MFSLSRSNNILKWIMDRHYEACIDETEDRNYSLMWLLGKEIRTMIKDMDKLYKG